MKPSDTPLTYVSALKEAEEPILANGSPGPEYADDRRLFQGIPGIERAPGGRFWCCCFSGGQGESPLNYVPLFTSGDHGETWKGPVLVVDGPGNVRVHDANVWVDPEGRLWLFWTQTHTLHDGRWGVWAITTENPDDENPKWSAPRRLMDGIMLNKPTVCRNGDWLFPVSLMYGKMLKNEKRMLPEFLRTYLLALMSPEEIQKVHERAGAWVYLSRDKGKSFQPLGCARGPEESSTHNEHMVIEKNDGSLWMLLRSTTGISESTSTDGGRTWSTVEKSSIPHPSSRFFLRRLQSGNLLLVKHGPMEPGNMPVKNRPGASPGQANPKYERAHLTAFLSGDEGKSWSKGLLLEERHCSYPDGIEAPDGTLYVTYDRGRRTEKEIMMARITEEDIRAGHLVSPQSRLGMIINRATGVISEAEDWSQFKGKDDPDEPLIFTGI